MSHDKPLKNMPSKVYVPLGRRGMEPITIKECLKCGSKDEVDVIDFKSSDEVSGENILETLDYTVKCNKCGETYIIRIKSMYLESKREENRLISTVFSVEGGEEYWIGIL
ncbi:MAG: hypothetical protein ACTSWP_04285 [Candidatus Freyarchaeota archaeon]|nr:hypothetical protein [Candidatus Freyrarchaeum guaymaensis]